MNVKAQDAAALSNWEEAAETALVDANHAFIDDCTEDINEFEKKTLVSLKCYTVDVRLIRFNEIYHIVRAVLDTGAGPNLVRRDVIQTSTTSLVMQMKTS